MEADGTQDPSSISYRPSSPVPTSTTGSDASKETIVIDLTSIREKRPTHRSPFVGKVATKRMRLDMGKEAALKTAGIDLRGMAYHEWDFVSVLTVPKAENKVCEGCAASESLARECKPAWDPSRSSHSDEGAIGCLRCFLDSQICSFGNAEWDIAGWPLIVESNLGRAIRKDRSENKGGEAGAAAREKMRAVPRVTFVKTTRTRASEPVNLSVPSPVPGFLPENLVRYEAALSDPARTIVSLQTQRTELQSLRLKEEQRVETIRTLVVGRGQIFQQLIWRFDRAVESLGGGAIVDSPGADSDEAGGVGGGIGKEMHGAADDGSGLEYA